MTNIQNLEPKNETRRYKIEVAMNRVEYEAEVDVPVGLPRAQAEGLFMQAIANHLKNKKKISEKLRFVCARVDRAYGGEKGQGGLFQTYLMEKDDSTGHVFGEYWIDAYPA